ncbi:helix-turn-helix domain-containing protein, partial [Neolewinella agarilytica]
NQRLVQLRKEHNLSQSELAKKIGIHANVVGRYERGEAKPSIEQVLKIADVFDVSMDYLTGKVDEAIEPKLMQQMISLQQLPQKEKEHILFTLEALVRDTITRLSYAS